MPAVDLRSGAGTVHGQPEPMIGPWRDELDRPLSEKPRRPTRVRLTCIRLFLEFRTLGSEGGHDAVWRGAASWSQPEVEASAAAYVPLGFDPVEDFPFY